MSDQKTIGFVGTGVMGSSMAGHLLDAGHQLFVHNRSKDKAHSLLERGATWCETLSEVAAQSKVVISMVGYPADVEATYLGKNGLLANSRPGMLFIDMTTSDPQLAVKIANKAESLECAVLDAPVSGGDIGAQKASLSIMVGGSADAFKRALPLLERMGKSIIHQGSTGSGQHCKMANQIAIASGMMGVCEAMAYAERAGLDPTTVLRSIESGAAGSWSLSNLAPRMLKGDFAPGFYVKHFIKDLRIALESAQKMKLAVPGLSRALELYERLAKRGHSDNGTQALYRLYRD